MQHVSRGACALARGAFHDALQQPGAVLAREQHLSQLDGYAAGSAKVATYAGGLQLNLADGTHIQFASVSQLPGF